MVIVDEQDNWTQNEEEDAPVVVESVEFNSLFKSQNAGWDVINEGTNNVGAVETIGHTRSPIRRRSPSASPIRSPSPVRSRRRSPSLSPVHKSKKSPSPVRRIRSPSNSPVRGRKRTASQSPEKNPANLKRNNIDSVRMSDGTLAGLQTGKQLKKQMEQYQRDASPVHGKNEETIYRDKTGRIIDMAAQKAEFLREKEKRQLLEQESREWGKGIVQKKEAEAYNRALEEEKNRGLAVYADDKIRNDELKEKVRWGDTMASISEKKKKKRKKDKEYKIPVSAPNRFGIPPGRKWDGIDRSNGYEVKLFQAKQQGIEKQKEAHRYVTEDM
jgi:pre-mRNA-splicing factor CWC26